MRSSPIRYSDDELRWIKRNCDLPRAELHARFCEMFNRPDVPLHSIKNLCKRNGWFTGRTGQFAPGQAPMNKGKKMPLRPASAATAFKPGHVPANAKPIGTERLANDGYILIKVPLPNPYTGHATRYMHKHRYLWEQVNGPLPKGYALKALDGNKLNTDPANWEAIPRALLPRLNGRFGRDYDTAPAEVKPTLLAIAKLEHKARELRPGRDDE